MRILKRLGASLSVVLAVSAAMAAAAWATSPPVNTSPPTIAPNTTPEQNEVLNAGQGAWANEPTSYADQWQRCNTAGAECANIAGATTTRYTVAAADVGHRLVFKVTAKNSAGEASAASAASAVVLEVKAPQLSPAPTEKEPLEFTGTSSGMELNGVGDWDCRSSKITGAFINATEAKNVIVTFSECSSGLGPHTSVPLRATLGYVSEANHSVALKLAPETGNIWVSNWWDAAPLEGALIGGLGPVNTKTTTLNLTYRSSGGVQELRRFERPLLGSAQHLAWDKGSELVVSAEFHITLKGAATTIKG